MCSNAQYRVEYDKWVFRSNLICNVNSDKVDRSRLRLIRDGQSRKSMRAKMCLITVFNAKHIEILFQKPERQDRGYGQSRMSMRAKGRSCWAALVSSSLFGNTLTVAHWTLQGGQCTLMLAHWTLQSGQCILQTEN